MLAHNAWGICTSWKSMSAGTNACCRGWSRFAAAGAPCGRCGQFLRGTTDIHAGDPPTGSRVTDLSEVSVTTLCCVHGAGGRMHAQVYRGTGVIMHTYKQAERVGQSWPGLQKPRQCRDQSGCSGDGVSTQIRGRSQRRRHSLRCVFSDPYLPRPRLHENLSMFRTYRQKWWGSQHRHAPLHVWTNPWRAYQSHCRSPASGATECTYRRAFSHHPCKPSYTRVPRELFQAVVLWLC